MNGLIDADGIGETAALLDGRREVGASQRQLAAGLPTRRFIKMIATSLPAMQRTRCFCSGVKSCSIAAYHCLR